MAIKKLIKPLLLVLSVLVVAFCFIKLNGSHRKTEYLEHLTDTAVSVDGYDITFEDMAFYILYEERVVEEQARIYNPDSTKDYWNIHTNDTFIQVEVKDAIMGMAIHDRLFYELAVLEGMSELTPDEENDLEYAQTDFWEDLLDEQWDRLPCSQDIVNNQIRMAAIAEKYQNYLAQKDGPSIAAYKYDGFYYQQILEQHEVKINKKLWDNFVVGDITIHHGDVNYINGLTNEDKKKNKK